MRIKNTAFAYNVTVQGSSNCDWGTDIGQSRKHTFTLEGFPEFINAMAYYKIEDVEKMCSNGDLWMKGQQIIDNNWADSVIKSRKK